MRILQAHDTQITFKEAVYMAAVVGDKGEDRLYECEGASLLDNL